MKLTRIQRSALVLHPAHMMFDLVNDIESYPDYMDGCEGAEVIARTDEQLVGRLDLAKFGITQSFTTRNQLTRPECIVMRLEDGPFNSLWGEWRFKKLTETACKVSLILEFELKSGFTHVAGGKLFTRVANNLVAATTERADIISEGRPMTGI
jgi:ribosome-associated toxin RatA of RatAB toxin-antitoxin module